MLARAAAPAIDFSITEESLEQPPLGEAVPPGAPGLAKITLVVTEEDGQRVRRTLHDLTARVLGVDTPHLPSIQERKNLALNYAQVCCCNVTMCTLNAENGRQIACVSCSELSSAVCCAHRGIGNTRFCSGLFAWRSDLTLTMRISFI